MHNLTDEVNRALRARGWSGQHASRQVGASPHRPAANCNEGDDVEITVTTTDARAVESFAEVRISVVATNPNTEENCIPGHSTEEYFRCDYIADGYLDRELKIRVPPNRNTGVPRVPTRNNDRIDNKVTFKVEVVAGSEVGLRFTDDKTETFIVGDEEIPLAGTTLPEGVPCTAGGTDDTCDYADKILISAIPIADDTPIPEGDRATWLRPDIRPHGRLHNTLPVNGTYSNYDFSLVFVNFEGSASRHNDCVDADIAGAAYFPGGSTTVYYRVGIVDNPQLGNAVEPFAFYLFQNALTEQTFPVWHPQYTGVCPMDGSSRRGANIKIADDDTASFHLGDCTGNSTNNARPTVSLDITGENGDCCIPFPTYYSITCSNKLDALESSGVIENRKNTLATYTGYGSTLSEFPPCTASRDIFNVAASPSHGTDDFRVTLQYTGADSRFYPQHEYWDVGLDCPAGSCARTVTPGPSVDKRVVSGIVPQPELPSDLLPCGRGGGVGCYFVTYGDDPQITRSVTTPLRTTTPTNTSSRSCCGVDQSKAASYGARDYTTGAIRGWINRWYTNPGAALRDCPIINDPIQSCDEPGTSRLRQGLRYHEVCFVAGNPNNRQFYVRDDGNWPDASRWPERSTATRSSTTRRTTPNGDAQQRRVLGQRATGIDTGWCAPLATSHLRAPDAPPLPVTVQLDSAANFDTCAWVNDSDWELLPACQSCRGDTGVLPLHTGTADEESGTERIEFGAAIENLIVCVIPLTPEPRDWLYRVPSADFD